MRIDGYAPIRDYAAIGDGVASALVARDGAIDWLCLPAHESPSVFGALLDADRGGAFTLAPAVPFTATRRYRPHTNVLETTFETDRGTVRVTDALSTQDGAVLPWRELVRRVEGLRGTVPLEWRVAPRFDYARERGTLGRAAGVPVFRSRQGSLAVLAHDAGEIEAGPDAVGAAFDLQEGQRSLVALVAVEDGPIHVPDRSALEQRLDWTIAAWRRFVRRHEYQGPWTDAVERSLLALMLLVDTRSGAIAAAPTTSLPERVGGDRNYDYRYSWPRDSSFTLLALLHLGFAQQAHESYTWLLRALDRTHPRVRPVYRLDGSPLAGEDELPLAGYRGSRPVRIGNCAADQLQLGGYGDVFDATWLYVRAGNDLGPETGASLAGTADVVCDLWRSADSGIWELRGERQFTYSKVSAWLALRRAIDLAALGQVPADRVASWEREARAIRAYVETACWSDELGAYTDVAGGDDVDASLLLMIRCPWQPRPDERLLKTLAAVRERLACGPLVYRSNRLRRVEHAFVACSFWLVEALSRAGRLDEAAALMDEAVALSNDVGLLSEEIDPASGDFYGNFPQGLSHLSLVNAAVVFRQAAGAANGRPASRARAASGEPGR